MFEALTMEAGEKAKRLTAAADVVRSNDVERWLRRQLDDLRSRM
jgi:trehalose-6-phosphate synthase